MWVIGSIFYLVPLVTIAVHLLSPQSPSTPRRPGTLRQGSIAVLATKATRFDLLRLPLHRLLCLRWRYGRMALAEHRLRQPRSW